MRRTYEGMLELGSVFYRVRISVDDQVLESLKGSASLAEKYIEEQLKRMLASHIIDNGIFSYYEV